MIELMFVVCLSTAPTECENRSLLFTDISPMACMMGAQPELAKWAESHPRYSVGRWSCRYVNTAQKDA